MIDPHKLGTVHPTRVGVAAMSAFSNLQNFPPEVQAAALGCLVILFCRAHKTHVGNVLAVANNVIDDVIGHNPQLDAADAYVKGELK